MDLRRTVGAGALTTMAAIGSAAWSAPTPDLEIAVTDGKDQVGTGDRLDYTIKVQNNEAKAVPATVRVELPNGMVFVSGQGAKADGPAVTWRTQLPPTKSTELRFAAKLSERPKGTQVKAMAATACALTDGALRPVVCATDIDPLAESSMMSGTGGTTMVIGGLAIAALAAGGAAWWLLRRRKPALPQPTVPEEPRVPTPS